ncbi:MAG TPA: UDP-N-acetylmuramoyl-L-alanyl-D-glutamate--2,6-diaminopimelate ligase [Patescibacteria group bacterium]|nr:UDP-N-acetylmuramoyl-L-alanyl-D-glutamate--2,6-diaminopimelate ligase [Patescibacteria group bacterium]
MKVRIKNVFHFFNAVLAVTFYGYPARKLTVIGVTGTDGKTTTAALIYQILKKAGEKVALITTVNAYIGRRQINTGFHVTTPNPWSLQKLVKDVVDAGCKHLILEATSHGLDQYRVLGTNISIAVVTNITHEHLDYHKTYLNYLKAKAKIFKHAKIAILNKTDSSYKRLIKYLRKDTKLISYDSKINKEKIKKAVDKRFPEIYNKFNAAAAISVAKELGIKESDIIKAIKSFSSVTGRMEYIKNNKGINIIIDFAHTPNALENVLKALKTKIKKGRLIAVFGCAGERDKAKRPMMGAISTKYADVSIFTAEDPRHEDMNNIIDAMVKGVIKGGAKEVDYQSRVFSKKPVFLRIKDRQEAISFAINNISKRGDTIVICGKGHEKSMNYEGIEHPWTDKDAVNKALKVKNYE